MQQTASPRAVFMAAIDISDDRERARYVALACGDDRSLREKVEKLLAAHHDQEHNPLDDVGRLLVAAGTHRPETLEESSPARVFAETIGPYRLREQIGEGGMGVVYVAEQTEPIRRKVALKIVKPGMDSKEVVARFEAEKQALALMDHPHVARVIDAGTTERGRPYFVMELVRGFPITEYCDEARLDTRQRLELFLKVCQGVQHAHLKGIIHRDLKPSNVLVTVNDGVPVPKVIDFGVAKALHQKLTDHTIYTQFRQMIGTPAYMSPEQAEMSGLDVDTRSDVYSLGVLLYELLTGTTPFDKETLRSKPLDEMRRMICEQDPPRPSQRISTLDAAAQSTLQQRRGLDSRQFSQSLQHELDWIVMKALDKDRNRRYQSASELAQDIGRYLHGAPVEACPPSTLYQLQKYIHRHRTLLAMTALVLFVAAIGTASSLWHSRQKSLAALAAIAAQAEAERATDRAETLLYTADMKLASDAVAAADVQRAIELLHRHPGRNAKRDPRGFEWHFFHKLINQRAVAEIEQGNWVDDVAISPDGAWLATNGPHGEVLIFETSSWQWSRTLPTEADAIDGLDWSADGARLAAACSDGTVRLWNHASGGLDLTIAAHEEGVNDVVFGPHGRVLFSSGGDGRVRSWNAETGEPLREFVGHVRVVERVAVSPNGRFLATASSDHSFGIWEAETGKLIALYPTGIDWAGRVTCVAFSPDGSRVAAGNIYGEVHLTETSTGESRRLVHQTDGIESLAFFEKGTWLATADRSGAIQLHHLETLLGASETAAESSLKWTAHEGRAISLMASPDGQQLISGGRDGAVRVWAPDPQATRWTPRKARAFELGFVPCNVAVGSNNHALISEDNITVWNLQDRRRVKTFAHAESWWENIACSTDGRFVAACRIGQLALFDVASGRMVEDWLLERPTGDPVSFMIHLAISSDGGMVAVTETTSLDFISLHRRGERQSRRIASSGSQALAFSPCGRWLAAAVREVNAVRLWDLQEDGEPRTLRGHTDTISDLAFSPDGELLATTGHDRLLKVFRVVDGQERFSIVAHADRVWSVAFSPDGRTIATADGQGTIKLWHTATAQPLGELPRERRECRHLAFSSDGMKLVGRLADNTIVVYDATPADGRPVVKTTIDPRHDTN